MNQEQALSRIDPKHHKLAIALQAGLNIDWMRLVDLIGRALPLLQELFDILINPQYAAPGGVTSHCDEAVKKALLDNCNAAQESVCAAVRTYCAAHCAATAAGCDHDHS